MDPITAMTIADKGIDITEKVVKIKGELEKQENNQRSEDLSYMIFC